MYLFIEYPSWISPTIFSGLPIRWYSLMYLVAFAVAFLLVCKQIKRKEVNLTVDEATTLFLYTIAGLILGARLFSTLFYDGTGYYWTHPWLIFWPFSDGQFVGLPGMSYHGGLVGTTVGAIIFCKVHKKDFWHIADALIAGIPLGYTFGRLGNFINGELWGRVSTAPWAMVFPDAPSYSTGLEWVKNFADTIGLAYVQGEMLNLPRHPSQLYEALFEGIILWILIWFVFKRIKKHDGFLLAWYLIGYGFFRFVIEYVREPDANLGFIIQLGDKTAPIALFESFLNISMGQLFCLLMIIVGIVLLYYTKARGIRLEVKRMAKMNRGKKKKKKK
ncbi:MAG: prolipoprotein diacylglyceryl transferase [Sphaerochaetaceae bacterium]|nr:prolipoprotein diacylglyceryl transferase [Sphaerochaetaceae bacterium]